MRCISYDFKVTVNIRDNSQIQTQKAKYTKLIA